MLDHIDGEPARTAEAVARKAEEMRELAVRTAEAYFHAPVPVAQLYAHLAALPLTTTPLADELRNTKRLAREKADEAFQQWERAEKAEAENRLLRNHDEIKTTELINALDRTQKAERQVKVVRDWAERNKEPVEDNDMWSMGYADAIDDVLKALGS
jgi:hypothetical protein